MDEVEKKMSQLVAQQKEENKKEFEVLKDMVMKELDTALQKLNILKIAHNDLLEKNKHCETEIEEMIADVDSFKERLSEYAKTSNAKSLKNTEKLLETIVMEGYEKTISQLVAQKEDKKEFEVQKNMLMKERDTALQQLNKTEQKLNKMEIAYNDLLEKYERSKTVIEGIKANVDMSKKSLSEYDEAMNATSESLKNHTKKQLETTNQELDHIRRSHQAEVPVTSLEESLEQESEENQELAAVCDELISKVGSTGKGYSI